MNRPLLAYIDPGTAGFVIASVLGFLAAIGYTTRATLNRIKRLVRSGRLAREGEDPPGQPDT